MWLPGYNNDPQDGQCQGLSQCIRVMDEKEISKPAPEEFDSKQMHVANVVKQIKLMCDSSHLMHTHYSGHIIGGQAAASLRSFCSLRSLPSGRQILST